jgi:hypothetical protein
LDLVKIKKGGESIVKRGRRKGRKRENKDKI